MIKKILLFVISIVFFFPTTLFAIDSNIEIAYTELISRLNMKYPAETQQVILKDFNDRLEDFLENTSKPGLIPLIDDLKTLNNEKLYQLWLELELSIATQKIQELREISAFKSSMPDRVIPDYVSSILSSDIKYINTDDSREFYEDNDIKRVIYSSYVPITESNATRLKNKAGIIIYDTSSGYRFIEDYTFEIKIPYSKLASKFNSFLTENHRISEKNGNYYAYNFINFRYFEDKYGAYTSSLETSGFDYDSTLLYKREDGGYNFVTDYDEYLISSTSVLYGVPEKDLLLDYLREDTKFQTNDISSQLSGLKNLSKILTNGKSRDESIAAIYAWILNNIEYSSVIDLSDEKIFSGIETFKSGEGVCTGYTKLSSYLFYFAGYHDVEVIRGHVIDAQDFPQIGHAWLKIGDLYYDPTFDDPIGAQNTRAPSDYKYFGLPRDIFYANRYDYGDLPEYLNTASKNEIHQHIFDKLTNLIPKYQNSLTEYPVFGEVVFRNNYNLSVTTNISPELLASKVGSYTVENNSFRFVDNSGTQKQIEGFRYYPLSTENTSAVLDIFGYDTDSLTLFNWQKESGDYEWRLAYELEVK